MAGAILLMVQTLAAATVAFNSASDYDSNFYEPYNGSLVAWTGGGGGYLQKTGSTAAVAVYNTAATGGSGGSGGTAGGSPLNKFSDFTIQADYSTPYIGAAPSNSLGFYIKIDDAGIAGYAVVFRVISGTTVDVRLFESNGTLSNAGVGSQIGSTVTIAGPANSFLANTFYTFKVTVTDVGSNVQFDASAWTAGGAQIGSVQSLTDTSSAVTGLGQVGVRLGSDVRMDNFVVTDNVVTAPAFSPGGGTYSSAQSVTMTSATPGASIRYTTNGTTPTATMGTVYSGPVTIAATTTLKAIAYKSGMTDSTLTTATYTITAQTPSTVAFGSASDYDSNFYEPYNGSLVAWTGGGGGYLQKTGSTAAVAVYNTAATGGSGGSGGTAGGAALNKFSNFTIQADYSTPYIGSLPANSIGFYTKINDAGTAGYAAIFRITSATTADFRLFESNGTLSNAGVGSQIGSTVTITGPANSFLVNTFYTIKLTVTDVGSNVQFDASVWTAGGTQIGSVQSLTDTSSAVVGLGQIGVRLASDVSMDNFAVTTAASPVTTPAFSPGGGTYSSAQSVTMTSATSGASIRYTTNGTTPTATTGTVYSGPVTIAATTTLKAIAYKSGMTDSPVTTATYTIATAQTAAPSLSPSGGTFYAPQTVTLSTATGGASIRYTTNGSTPTPTTGTLYSSPVSITGNTTLKAIAYKSGLTDSAVTSATYTILAYDSYIPTRDDVGVTAMQLSELTEYNAPTTELLNWTTGGTASNPLVISGKIIYGQVVRKASYVTFINCLFRGPPTRPTNETGVINCDDITTSGWKFYDCTIAPQYPNANLNGFKGHEFKAFRCHVYWVIDGFGVYTHPSSTRATNVEIAGCLVEYLAYYPGTHYADKLGNVLTPSGTYVAYSSGGTFVTRATAQPSDVPWIDQQHRDGNHNDSVQIHGAYGRMTRGATVDPATGIKPWSGTGVYVHGNTFLNNDAWECIADPSGLGLPVPGKSGSLAGSRLGFGDNPKRGVSQTPTMARPVTSTTYRLMDGGYAANGTGVIAQHTVNKFPYPDTTYPNDYSVVVAANYFNDMHTGISVSELTTPPVSIALLYNQFGRNIFVYNPTGNKQIYPIRVNRLSASQFAPADDGTPGLATNRWLDLTNYWRPDGTSLYWIPRPHTSAQATEVRTSGIWFNYD